MRFETPETSFENRLTPKSCYFCGKPSHDQYKCRSRPGKPPRKSHKLDRFYSKGKIDEKALENPHELSYCILGVPPIPLNLTEFGKALIQQTKAKIESKDIALSRPWLRQRSKRSGDLLIKFSSIDVQNKFKEALWKVGVGPHWWPWHKLKLEFNGTSYTLNIILALGPTLDKVYSKALVLEEMFDCKVRRNHHYGVEVQFYRNVWSLKTLEDIQKVKRTLDIMERTTRGQAYRTHWGYSDYL